MKLFWVTTQIIKKKLSKKLLKVAYLVLLGSWLVVWEANEICTFLVEYENFKNNKGNYLISKLQISFIMLAKTRVISARSLQI